VCERASPGWLGRAFEKQNINPPPSRGAETRKGEAMASDATIQIEGNLTRDPNLRCTSTGRPVASFGVAVRQSEKDESAENGWRETAPIFFDVTVWNTLAENAAETLHKGNRVVVTGRLEQPRYTGNDGTERTTLSITGDTLGRSLRFSDKPKPKPVSETAPDQPAKAAKPAKAAPAPAPVAAFDDEDDF